MSPTFLLVRCYAGLHGVLLRHQLESVHMTRDDTGKQTLTGDEFREIVLSAQLPTILYQGLLSLKGLEIFDWFAVQDRRQPPPKTHPRRWHLGCFQQLGTLGFTLSLAYILTVGLQGAIQKTLIAMGRIYGRLTITM